MNPTGQAERIRRAAGGALLALASLLAGAGVAYAQPATPTAPAAPAAGSAASLDAVVAERLKVEATELCAAAGIVDAKGPRRTVQCAPGTGRKLAGDAVMEVGSVSKAFLGILLADAVLRGEVKLDDPVQRYLPADALAPTADGEPIRLLHLATHTSGLPRLPAGFRPADLRDPYASLTERQLLSLLTATQLERAPGRGYEYSNFGSMLLSYALGRAAGKRFDVLLAERLTRPLGMSATHVVVPEAQRMRVAQGHDATGAAVPAWTIEPSLAGVGMIRSTLDDMLKFVAANVNPPAGQLGRAILGAQEAHIGGGRQLGLGWHLIGRESPQLAFHDGVTGGFSAAVAINRSAGVGAVVMADAARGLNDLALHLVDPARPLKQPRARVLLEAALLDEYVGTYEFTPAFSIAITRRGERLFAQATNQPAVEVFAEGKDLIYWTVVDARARFGRDDAGKVSGMTFMQGGRTARSIRTP